MAFVETLGVARVPASQFELFLLDASSNMRRSWPPDSALQRCRSTFSFEYHADDVAETFIKFITLAFGYRGQS